MFKLTNKKIKNKTINCTMYNDYKIENINSEFVTIVFHKHNLHKKKSTKKWKIMLKI